MEPATPLDYAPPAVPRRTRVAAGILAYLFASYTVGISFAIPVHNDVGWAGLLVVVALLPALIPLAVLLAALRVMIGLLDVVVLTAFVAAFALAFRYFRRPQA